MRFPSAVRPPERAVVALLLVLLGCGGSTAPAASDAAARPPASAVTAALPIQPAPGRARFVEDDFAGALALARQEKKLLFVDAWAPWCHTCLSMRETVLDQRDFAAFGDRYVFAALDTDRPGAAGFLERYRVTVWPSFFVLDPASGEVLALRGGSLSLAEMVSLLEHTGLAEENGQTGEGTALLADAHAKFSRKELSQAADLYERAAASVPDARRSEALLGAVRSRYEAAEYPACASYGVAHASAVVGSSAPVDFLYYARACAKKLAAGSEQKAALAALGARLRQLAEAPPEGASVDDVSDLLANAAEDAREGGEAAQAETFEKLRLGLLERAASEAQSPAAAQVFDYARLGAYVALGRAAEAVEMLEQRTKQLPDNYEAHARLASALRSAGRTQAALASIERAIALSYGPRRLRYLSQRSAMLGELGEKAAATQALREELAGWQALPEGQRDSAHEKDAADRLAAALATTRASPRSAPR